MKNDTAYNNGDFIPDGADYPDRWAEEARAFREVEAAVGRARLNVAYGEGARAKRWMSFILRANLKAWLSLCTVVIGCALIARFGLTLRPV